MLVLDLAAVTTNTTYSHLQRAQATLILRIALELITFLVTDRQLYHHARVYSIYTP
jgi:hypothetical protein